MADKPIPFKPEMVRALLAGRKTQTRRILKPQPRSAPIRHDGVWTDCGGFKAGPYGVALRTDIQPLKIYAPGDRIWVKEAHWAFGRWEYTGEATKTGKEKIRFIRNRDAKNNGCVFNEPTSVIGTRCVEDRDLWHPRSSLFMSKSDCRLFLPVTDVRVQRVQEISEEDAKAEGITEDWPDWHDSTDDTAPYAQGFSAVWADINGLGAWDENPWVAAYSFTVERRNIDA